MDGKPPFAQESECSTEKFFPQAQLMGHFEGANHIYWNKLKQLKQIETIETDWNNWNWNNWNNWNKLKQLKQLKQLKLIETIWNNNCWGIKLYTVGGGKRKRKRRSFLPSVHLSCQYKCTWKFGSSFNSVIWRIWLLIAKLPVDATSVL